ncbi:hypothetical protein CC78DRAFT_496945 [Lojkania enalia]|uniref:Uncharacterized protein n=1 Tax=Lojkania enalia TaxID=147567 RepID=A0A9P4MZA4_9PLEO|nr:hypothetical protein CC78DRAFT_496945 [Didymosphaeria enalia]
MPLRKRLKKAFEPSGVGGEPTEARRVKEVKEVKRSKRKKFVDFFKSNKGKAQETTTIPAPIEGTTLRKSPRDSRLADPPSKPVKSSSSDEVTRAVEKNQRAHDTQLSTTVPETRETEKQAEAAPERLSEEQLHALFSGAPHFFIKKDDGRLVPSISRPWDAALAVRDVSDAVQLAQPAFSAATMYQHLPLLQDASEQAKPYQGYNIGVVEIPSMLSAQGIEPGSVGWVHFLELPVSDSLSTDLQRSQSSNGVLEGVRNKEQLQSNPEKLGIRAVDMRMVYDRLVEFGDLLEVFQDSPERMTILNNQSSGDLYANLFGKFLMPPKYDDTTDDPTGVKVQIDTLLRILSLRGVWHDFSLVEWRIRLGQILWSDPELEEDEPDQSSPLWSERDILLLQITLACELLLRLDAISSMDPDAVIDRMKVNFEEWQSFKRLKTKKTDWDLVLARRFLDNILVIKEIDMKATETPKHRTLLSMLKRDSSEATPEIDVIFAPRHQSRQLSGLLHFAETIQWPGHDMVLKLW